MSAELPKTSHATIWIGSIIAALLLYVLSYGPAVAYLFGMDMREPPARIFDTFYTPLGWVTETVPGAGSLLSRYEAWWLEIFHKP